MTKGTLIMSIDKFYPKSFIFQFSGRFWEGKMIRKLSDHLTAAKEGDRVRESRLINRIGQIRRNVKDTSKLSTDMKSMIAESIEWLEKVGRKVDFKNPNPALWITARDGKTPRWK